MKVIATYTDSYEAHIAEGLLRNAGILAEVINESTVFPGLGNISDVFNVKLVVNEEDYDLALKILAAPSSNE
ncbi:MAG: DUF2007 domain-containing protein [Bacteroidales bacterium]|nr:DUF2007 domain-containing protein [Bacteroidales bacterium]MDD3200679.1 DUF2007 domain-containing protein [Bacteroidales bacterium]